MTSHALGGLAGSRRTSAMQQRAASGRHGHVLGCANLRCMRNPTRPTSIYAHLLEEQSCQISSRSDLKRRNLIGFFKERCHNNKMNNNNKISSRAIWDQFLFQKAAAAAVLVVVSHVLHIVNDKPFHNALKCFIILVFCGAFCG